MLGYIIMDLPLYITIISCYTRYCLPARNVKHLSLPPPSLPLPSSPPSLPPSLPLPPPSLQLPSPAGASGLSLPMLQQQYAAVQTPTGLSYMPLPMALNLQQQQQQIESRSKVQ